MSYGTYAEIMHACNVGSMAIEICKSKDMGKPMQFEFLRPID